MSTWGRILGAASLGTGLIGAAALGGVTAQRRAVRRYRVSTGEDEPGYDLLAADRSYSVLGDDGVVLYVEEVGPLDAPLTVVFGHGWSLRSGAWHYQRLGLADWTPPGSASANPASGRTPGVRLVFFDQRSHGKSSRASFDRTTMADLAGDLAAVMATAAPDGPVVLVGHSMGGMALITLAGLRPTLFADRVAGVGLVSTSAGAVSTDQLARALLSGNGALVKLVSNAVSRYPQLIERGRAGGHDAVWLLTRTLGFARKDVPGELVDYLDEMISGTPIDVITDFLPALLGLDQAAALPVLADLPVVVICGDQDRQTPIARSRAIAAELPDAELVILEGAGHMAILERPDLVNEALRDLFDRAMDHAAGPAPEVGTTGTELLLPTPGSTDALGRALGARLRAGDLVILSGSLGAGKTALTKGIGAGLGVAGTITSPTFVIARVHPPAAGGVALVHVDAYRLAGAVELDDLDLDTDLTASAVVIEWGEGVAEQLSDTRLVVALQRLPDDTRIATLTPVGGDWAERIAGLAP